MKNWRIFAVILTIPFLLTGVFFLSGCSTPPANAVFTQFDITQAEWSINSTPTYNNFRTLGFVTVETTLTGTSDSNGRISWNGNDITYSGLIQKAKTLNADAVINIVIDTVDTKEIITTGGRVEKKYTRKRTATGLAIKYLEWRTLVSKINPLPYELRLTFI